MMYLALYAVLIFSRVAMMCHIVFPTVADTFSIHELNEYGPNHPCRIVLLTLATSRGVTSSWLRVTGLYPPRRM